MADQAVVPSKVTNPAHSGVAQHSGNIISDLEVAVTKVTEQNKPRCQNEIIQNHGFDPCSATPCNAPNAEFYQWTDGGLDHEMFLCGSCADSLGVF